VENKNYSVDFLKNENLPNSFGGYYLGTLVTKAARKKQAKAATASQA